MNTGATSGVFGGSPASPATNVFAAPTFGGSAFSFKSSVNQLQQQTMQTQQPSVFGQSTQSSPFGQVSSMTASSPGAVPAFGSSASFSSPFSSGFGQSAFGSTTTAASAFGAKPTFGGSIFGGNSTAPSTFGAVAASAPTNPIFGASGFSFKNAQQQIQTEQSVQPSSVFSGNMSQTSSGLFSAPSNVNAPSVHGHVGGATVAQTSPFGQQNIQETSKEAAQPTASSLFATSTESMFGKPASASKSLFGGELLVKDNPEDCYSEPAELSPDDIVAFQLESFEFGKIPLIAPPIALCV
jgi:hypothetical protein